MAFIVYFILLIFFLNFTLLIICQSNVNFKNEWIIQNELLQLKLEKLSIRMGFTWQGSDHIQEI